MEKAVAVAGHHLGEVGIFVPFELRQLVRHGLLEDFGVAHAHVAAAGIGVGLPGAVGLERQIFGVGLGEAADPVVEGVVGHGVPHGTAEAVAAVPFLTFGGRHVGVALDEGVKSLPCIVDGARGDEQSRYRQILAGGDVSAVFPRPVPADPQLSFQKLVAGVEGPHGDEGAA